MEGFEIIIYSIAALSVGIYSGNDFNRPEYSYSEPKTEDDEKKEFWERAKPGVPKYMTEGSRYQIYRLAFILFSVTVFFCIAFFLPVPESAGELIEGYPHPELLRKLIKPAGATAVLLGLVKIKYFDLIRHFVFGRFKGWLHSFANIPEMGRNIYENLCFQAIDYQSEIAQTNIQDLLGKNYTGASSQREDIRESDFKIGNTRTITWKWARLSYGINIIENWSLDPVYGTQLKEPSLQWLSFRQEYIEMINDVISHRSGSLSEEQQVKLNRDAGALLANCHRLIACLVFMVAKSTEDPLIYLQKSGYKVSPGERFTVNKGEFARILFSLFPTILMFAFATTLLPTHLKIDVPLVINYCFCAMIIMVFPVYIVFSVKEHLTVKQTWRKVSKDNNYHSFFEMPLGLYSSLSLVTWLAVTASMMLYTSHNKLHQLFEISRWETMSVFCLIGAVTAFFTAVGVDTLPAVYTKRIDCTAGRMRGALLYGVITCAIVWAGLNLSSGEGIPEYPLFGFILAVVLHITLFYKKHKFDTRKQLRKVTHEPATAMADGVPINVIVVDKSPSGACLQTGGKNSLKRGAQINLIPNNDSNISKNGIVVNAADDRVHVSFQEA